MYRNHHIFRWNFSRRFKWKKEVVENSLITVNQSLFWTWIPSFTFNWTMNNKDNLRETLSYSLLPTHSLIGAVFIIRKKIDAALCVMRETFSNETSIQIILEKWSGCKDTCNNWNGLRLENSEEDYSSSNLLLGYIS